MRRPKCDSAVLPVHKKTENFHAGNSGTSSAPPRPMGAGLAQGGSFFISEHRFSPEQFFFKNEPGIPFQQDTPVPVPPTPAKSL
jgi:hypothetical protein